jgi:alginate O-acetyltransferase complex protein AlgI
MLFSSIVFLSLFFPLTVGIYALVKKEAKNYVLLMASLLFYAWGEPRYLSIMLLVILLNYLGALCLTSFKKTIHQKIALSIVVALNLSILIYFKYLSFLTENFNALFGSNIALQNIVMPIGISFFIFQALSYTIDVYRKEVPAQKDLYQLALYISFFPQLIAGPIIKYHDIQAQILSRTESIDKILSGCKRFIIGLAKKVLIANTLGAVADEIFALPMGDINFSIAWLGAIAYSLQLYYDFSGYSDMAIGLGRIFGFEFAENFNYPYISKSITEFWRRWHISLGSWFREYLYIPLGGNRKGKNRTYVNLLLVFLTTGIWHGANWTFIVWGLWHGLFIIVERLIGIQDSKDISKNIFKHGYTILAFVIGWVLFRSDSLQYAFSYLETMFGFGAGKAGFGILYFLRNQAVIFLILGFVFALPVLKKISEYKQNVVLEILVYITYLFVFIISIWSILSSTYNPFIYFRF